MKGQRHSFLVQVKLCIDESVIALASCMRDERFISRVISRYNAGNEKM